MSTATYRVRATYGPRATIVGPVDITQGPHGFTAGNATHVSSPKATPAQALHALFPQCPHLSVGSVLAGILHKCADDIGAHTRGRSVMHTELALLLQVLRGLADDIDQDPTAYGEPDPIEV